MVKSQDILLAVSLATFIIIVAWMATGKCARVGREDYRDPLWMQPHKLYSDHYPRAHGSIYGTPNGGWDMFSGLNSYPKAY